ncbi:uncharacterized protein zgc:174935 [Betta splendens]|uniref:Uncharacterized protein zgc:174935 n=1 Tax=Betta splendens TaxID=158456 RepID=A0A6P7KTU3_BETSP|nr:uncharacterized protein zgc:174935 [Betta splendens]
MDAEDARPVTPVGAPFLVHAEPPHHIQKDSGGKKEGEMKLQILVPVAILLCVALFVLIKVRKTEVDMEAKRSRFQNTKLRVTDDVLREYESDKVETQKRLDKVAIDSKTLEDEANKLKQKADEAKGKADACQGSKKSGVDEAAKVETQLNTLKAETNKEKEKWAKEVETLKQSLNSRSPVCDFLKPDAQAGSKLCAVEGKKEEPKKEEPKKEEPKKEEPKKEEPKKEEPKKEEPKKEEPKKEEPKKEEPKKEEPKKEEPKKEEPKAGAPKK